MWSITAEGWQALLGIDGMRFDSRTNVHAGERTIIALSPKTLVDVDTGETFDLSPDDYASVTATTDGWVAYNGSEYTILSPTGEKKDTFRAGSGWDPDKQFGATPSQEWPSSEQYRGHVEEGDLSWAEASVSYTGLGKDGCDVSISFDGTTIESRIESTGTNCMAYPSVYSPSEGGEVMMALLDSPFSPESARIMKAWTLADQREITFPGSKIEYGEEHLLPRQPLPHNRVGLPERTGHGVRAGEGMTDCGRPGPQADSPRARPRRTYWRMPPLRK